MSEKSALGLARHAEARALLRFWFGEGSDYGGRRSEWFSKSAEFDAEIRARFLELHEQAASGVLANWRLASGDCLALIVLLDQFPRNLFRGEARAFACDGLAREAARHALAQSYDREALPVERMFYYLPFEHSEALEDQRLACALMCPLAQFPETDDACRYAERHREIVERFGRFPHRNAALGRLGTPEERAFLAQPGSGF
ncbi:MAG: DUF924 domain-containing protein [Betaproteobacteria bacterium]|nr:DUF924 domain-containing protein [Betaproteobacteria bacterium]